MMHPLPSEYLEQIPVLRNASAEEKKAFSHYARSVRIAAGTPISAPGDTCEQLAILLSGSVRVYQVGENGREITLYRIEQNESCVLTASCILSHNRFPVLAIAETPVTAVLIPAAVMRDWIARYAIWRDYIFGLMAERLANVIAVVEEVAFRRVDVRIAEFLLRRTQTANSLHITHQEIAFELGTAREVVSRILKDLEKDSLIVLARGTVTILDRKALTMRAQIS